MGFGVAVLGGGVDADQIARNQLEILQRERGGSVGLFCSLLVEQINSSLWAAVDRIVQREIVETVFVGSLDCSGDLFDGAGVIIVAGPH